MLAVTWCSEDLTVVRLSPLCLTAFLVLKRRFAGNLVTILDYGNKGVDNMYASAHIRILFVLNRLSQ